MTRASVGLHEAPTASPRRTVGTTAFAVVGCFALVLGACGGDDDDGESASATSNASDVTVTVAPTTVAVTTTLPTTTTTLPPLDLITDGASMIVANASGIDGAAGRMSDQLAVVGFSVGDATNSSESQLQTTKVYHDPENPNAKAVADSVRLALGGGEIQVLELGVPAPISDPDALGDATIVVAMGNDTADKSLDELQGRVPPAQETTDDGGTSEESTSEESTGEESTGEESTGEESTGEESTTEESTVTETTEAGGDG